MKAMGQRIADVAIAAVVLVLLAPTAARALGQLLVPLAVVVCLLCVARTVWFWTQL